LISSSFFQNHLDTSIDASRLFTERNYKENNKKSPRKQIFNLNNSGHFNNSDIENSNISIQKLSSNFFKKHSKTIKASIDPIMTINSKNYSRLAKDFHKGQTSLKYYGSVRSYGFNSHPSLYW